MIDHEEEKTELIKQAKLLFRSAAWVSAMDEKGGDDSLLLERHAMSAALRKFGMEKDYVSLVPVFNVILTSNKAWNEWSKDFSTFTDDLRAQAPLLSLEMRQCIYDLAYSVATRYRERNWLVAFFASVRISLRNFFLPSARIADIPQYLSISPLEKNALNELAEILNMPQRIIK